MKRISKIISALPMIILLFGCSKEKNKSYEKVDNTIYFGSYPQTLVGDTKIIDDLNSKYSKLPSKDNLNGWIDYNYYIVFNVESFMYYIDVDLDNDNNYDYRGVYFTKYRPNATGHPSDESHTSQLYNGYLINNVYWFKYEKIKWNILEENNGKVMIITDLLIDSHEYYYYISENETEHNGGVGRSNNYELSDIRKWLNEDFYSTSFNKYEKKIIEEVLIDNSSSQTDSIDNNYASNNTLDNITLLSYQEVKKYYSNSDERKAIPTDYAKCQGIQQKSEYSQWFLRSPSGESVGHSAFSVAEEGGIFSSHVNDSYIGVRPVIWIKL